MMRVLNAYEEVRLHISAILTSIYPQYRAFCTVSCPLNGAHAGTALPLRMGIDAANAAKEVNEYLRLHGDSMLLAARGENGFFAVFPTALFF